MLDLVDSDGVFSRRRGQGRVAEFILRCGLKVKEDGGLSFKGVVVSDSAVARVLNVDRRLIRATIGTILADSRLKNIFSKLDSIVLLRDVAVELGFGAIEVIPNDAASRGIVANVTKIIADAGISARQITTDDPMFENAEMIIVTEKPIPRELIDRILGLPEVEKVVVLN